MSLLAALLVAFAPCARAGLLGEYPMTRDASGTSWQPDSTPHEGLHVMSGDWMAMAHGSAALVWDRAGGPRGGEKAFVESMLMGMGSRPLAGGTLALRGMASLDPAMGPSGYPLLLQTGETADGRTALVDRQHPHDLVGELAASWSRPLTEDLSGFAYFGLVGEPALGPAAYFHRFSGRDDPAAPISHHWLDSTHVSEGVATLGAVAGSFKLEGSAFRGREPDQYRWDLEKPGFDSFSARLSWNPGPDWALQASYGHLVSPEALEPDVSASRATVSASRNWRAGGLLGQTTFAWGRDSNRPGRDLDAFLLESAARRGALTVFGRWERVDKDELLDHDDPAGGRAWTVTRASAGFVWEFARTGRAAWGAGAAGSLHLVPAALRPAYGGPAPGAVMLFLRARLA